MKVELDTRNNRRGIGDFVIHWACHDLEAGQWISGRLFGLSEHLERLSKHGDPLEVLDATVDFEYFRGWLVEGLGYGDGSKGGRPPFDPVSMFKALILQAQHNLSDARMEFMIRDRLSWMRFLGFDLGAPTPDENTIRHLPQQADRDRDAEAGDEGLRLATPEEGLHPDVGPDRRCLPGAGAEAAQHRGREGGDQGRQVRPRDLAGRAEQGGPEGRRRPLDAEDRRQGPVSPGRHAAADDRDAGLRLQVPHQHRPAVRLHPRERGDIGLGMRTGGMLKHLVSTRRTPAPRSGPTAPIGREEREMAGANGC